MAFEIYLIATTRWKKDLMKIKYVFISSNFPRGKLATLTYKSTQNVQKRHFSLVFYVDKSPKITISLPATQKQQQRGVCTQRPPSSQRARAL
jgi:hypothetical protein